MSYVSAIQKFDDVIVWERNELGERIEQIYKAPFYFYVDEDDGPYTTIYGTKVAKYEAANWSEFRKAKQHCEEKGFRMWESDIPPEMRILSNHYYGKPAPKVHITFYDIEVNYDPAIGFARVSNAYAPINSVALHHFWKNELVVICVPPEDDWTETRLLKECNKVEKLPADTKTRFVLCEDEKELLLHFLKEIEDADIICGWNSDLFDTPYVGKRLETHFGEGKYAMLDYKGCKPRYREVKAKKSGKVIGHTLDLQGRVSLDYMNLVKKYEAGERASFKLGSVADAVLVDDDDKPILPKMTYEGTLHDLYYKNFPFFIRYNIRDTEILCGFERKLAYVDLANQMCHISCALFSQVTGTLKLAEYATINHCHYKLKQVVPNFVPTPPELDRQIDGALVLEPKIGMHKYGALIDVKSEYPNSIRAVNISPETLRGQFVEKTEASEAIAKGTSMPLVLELETGVQVEKTGAEFRDWLLARKWAVSGYGTVFDQSVKGIMPTILEEWFMARKKYQALKKDADKAGDKEKAGYYDRLQYTYKIKLNSYYGALTNLYFRFYDIRMGESVTATGRAILRHQCSKVNELIGEGYSLEGIAVLYGDTDSTYFDTFADNLEDAVQTADLVAREVNKSFPQFMRDTFLCNPDFDNKIEAGRELVFDRGILVEKKHYILHVVDKEGKAVDEMKIMGLSTKKTTLPKHVQDILNKYVERLLKGEEWSSIARDVVNYKSTLYDAKDITELGLPKGIQDVEYFYDTADFRRYSKQNKRTGRTHVSGHVRAAMHYNRCLEEYGDKLSFPIMDGMKIKVFYLIGEFASLQLINGEEVELDSIALPTDAEFIPQWFLDNFRVNKDAQVERLVDKPLENILNAIGKEAPTKQTLLIDELLTF